MLAVGSFFPYLVMSGVIWPLEGMSKAMQILSYFLPQTLAIVSVRNVMLRGWAITYTFVWLGFVSTIIWTTIFLVFATIFSSI
jgi:ABC-type multidrug transport system permease subunit